MSTYNYYAQFEVSTEVEGLSTQFIEKPVEVDRSMDNRDDYDMVIMEQIIEQSILDFYKIDFVKVKVTDFYRVH